MTTHHELARARTLAAEESIKVRVLEARVAELVVAAGGAREAQELAERERQQRARCEKLERENGEFVRVVGACREMAEEAEAARQRLERELADAHATHAQELREQETSAAQELAESQRTVEQLRGELRSVEKRRGQVEEQLRARVQDLTGQLRRRDEHAVALESACEQAETLRGESDANHHQLMQEHRALLDTRQQEVIRITLYHFLHRKAAYCLRGWQDKTKAALLLRRAFANTVARMKLLFAAQAFDSWQSTVYVRKLLLRTANRFRFRTVISAFETWVEASKAQAVVRLQSELQEVVTASTGRESNLTGELAASVAAFETAQGTHEQQAAALSQKLTTINQTMAVLRSQHREQISELTAAHDQRLSDIADSIARRRASYLTGSIISGADGGGAVGVEGAGYARTALLAIARVLHSWASAARAGAQSRRAAEAERTLAQAKIRHATRIERIVLVTARRGRLALSLLSWKHGLLRAQVEVDTQALAASEDSQRAVRVVERHAAEGDAERQADEVACAVAAVSRETSLRAASEARVGTLESELQAFLHSVRPHRLLRAVIWRWRLEVHQSMAHRLLDASREAEVQRMEARSRRRRNGELVGAAFHLWSDTVLGSGGPASGMTPELAASQAQLLAAVEAHAGRQADALESSAQTHSQAMSQLSTQLVTLRVESEAAARAHAEAMESQAQQLREAETRARSAVAQLQVAEQLHSERLNAAVGRVLSGKRARYVHRLRAGTFAAWRQWDEVTRALQMRTLRLLLRRKEQTLQLCLRSWHASARWSAIIRPILTAREHGYRTAAINAVWAGWLEWHRWHAQRRPELLVAALRIRRHFRRTWAFGAWAGIAAARRRVARARRARLDRGLRALTRRRIQQVYHAWTRVALAGVNARHEAFLRREHGEAAARARAEEQHRTAIVDEVLTRCLGRTLRGLQVQAFHTWLGCVQRARRLRLIGRSSVQRWRRALSRRALRRWAWAAQASAASRDRLGAAEAQRLLSENEELRAEQPRTLDLIRNLTEQLEETEARLRTATAAAGGGGLSHHLPARGAASGGEDDEPAWEWVQEATPPQQAQAQAQAHQQQQQQHRVAGEGSSAGGVRGQLMLAGLYEHGGDTRARRLSYQESLSYPAAPVAEASTVGRVGHGVPEGFPPAGAGSAHALWASHGAEGPSLESTDDDFRALLDGIKQDSQLLRQQVGDRTAARSPSSASSLQSTAAFTKSIAEIERAVAASVAR